MSSPTILSPSSMAVEVFPHIDGNAPVKYVLLPPGPLTPITNMCSVSHPSLDALTMASLMASFFSPMEFPPYCVLTL